MTGKVNRNLEATLGLELRGPSGKSSQVEGIIDTGFTGALTLPKHLISELQLQWLSIQAAELADGSIVPCLVYTGLVKWHDTLVAVEVDQAETDPLIGMALLKGSDLRIAVERDGLVVITGLSDRAT